MLMVQSLIDYSIACMEVAFPHNLKINFRLVKCINNNVLTTTFTHFGVFEPYEAIKTALLSLICHLLLFIHSAATKILPSPLLGICIKNVDTLDHKEFWFPRTW